MVVRHDHVPMRRNDDAAGYVRAYQARQAMTSAHRMFYLASPLTLGNIGAWVFYVHDPLMTAFFALVGGLMAWLADWSER